MIQRAVSQQALPGATRGKINDALMAMMREKELKRRGLRFLPDQAVKRALRLSMEELRRQDSPEYWVVL